MSFAKIWMLRALETASRFAVVHLSLDLGNDIHGVYCRNVALEGFLYSSVRNWHPANIIELGPEYSGYAYVRADTDAVTCGVCLTAYSEFFAWACANNKEARKWR